MRVLKFLPLLLIFFVAACANDSEDAQKTIQAFLAAAEAGDAKAVEAVILPSERAKNKFTFDADSNPYKDEKHEITKVEVNRELAVVYLKVSGKRGPKGEKRWVCVKEEGKWYFSPEKSAIAMSWTGPGPKKDGK